MPAPQNIAGFVLDGDNGIALLIVDTRGEIHITVLVSDFADERIGSRRSVRAVGRPEQFC